MFKCNRCKLLKFFSVFTVVVLSLLFAVALSSISSNLVSLNANANETPYDNGATLDESGPQNDSNVKDQQKASEDCGDAISDTISDATQNTDADNRANTSDNKEQNVADMLENGQTFAVNADWSTIAEGDTITVEIAGKSYTFTYGTDAFSQLANAVTKATPETNIIVLGNGNVGVAETTEKEGTKFKTPGNYNISGSEWANLGYLQLNPSKAESSTRYVVNIDGSNLVMTKPQLRGSADLNITNSHTDFAMQSGASSGYIHVFKDSTVNVNNSVVGYYTNQGNSSAVTPGQTSEKTQGFASTTIYGSFIVDKSTIFAFTGDTKTEAISIYDRGLASFKDSVLYTPYIHVGKYEPTRTDRDTVGREGEIATLELNNSKVYRNNGESNGFFVGDTKDGKLVMINGSLLDYSDIDATVNSNGTIEIDGSSCLKVKTIANSGNIVVDMSNATDSVIKLVDSTNSGSNYGNYSFAEGKANGYFLQEINGDLFAIKGEIRKSIAINAAWTSKTTGEEVATGFYYGVNAFNNGADASSALTSETENVIAYGSASSLGDLTVGYNITLSTTNTDENDAMFTTIAINSGKSLTIADGAKINAATVTNNGTAKVTGTVKLSSASWTGNLDIEDATLTTAGFVQKSDNNAITDISGTTTINGTGFTFNNVYIAYGAESTTNDTLNIGSSAPTLTATSVTNNGHIVVDLTGATDQSLQLISATASSNYGDYKLKEGTQGDYSLSVENNCLVAKSKQTPVIDDVTYNAPTASLVYDGTGKAASFTTSKEGMGTITPMYATSISTPASEWTATAPKNVGTYYVMAKIDAGSSYRSAELTSEDWKFSITAAPLTVTPGANQSKVYDGTTAENITYSYSGQVSGETPSFSGALALNGNPAPVNKGTYQIVKNTLTCTDSNYTMTFTEGVTYEITLKGVTVAANNASKVYGESDPELTATVSGLVGSDTVVYTIARAKGENIGVYLINVAGDKEQGNYSVAYTAGEFEITPTSGSFVKVNKEDLENVKAAFEKESEYSGKTITVSVEVSLDDVSKEDVAKIQAAVGDKKLQNYDAKLVVKADDTAVEDAGSKNTVPVAISYSFDYSNKADFQCYRVHNGGDAEELSNDTSKQEYVSYDTQAGAVTIKAVKYSTYSVAYNDVVEPSPTPTPSSDAEATTTLSGTSATGDGNAFPIVILGLAVVVAAGTVVYLRCKNNK